jgi:hypothetical protein
MLANLGSNAAAARMLPAEYAALVAALGADAELTQALLDRDVATISRSLGGRATMVCMVAPAEEERPEESPDQRPEEPSSPADEPDRKN